MSVSDYYISRVNFKINFFVCVIDSESWNKCSIVWYEINYFV